VPILEANGAELYYEEFGSGSEVIVSAMSGFGKDSYLEVLARQNPGIRVFQMTLRGYGKSTHVFEDLGARLLDIWAEDVYAFTRKLGLDAFVYAGVSHGAGVGWKLALTHPEVLKGFVSIVGAPHDRRGGDSSRARLRTVEGAKDPQKLAESLRQQPLLYEVPTKDPLRLQRREAALENAIRSFASMTPEELRLNQRKPFPEARTNEELAEILSRVKVPTLLLCGMQDDIISAEISLLAARSVPGAKAVFFQDHSHSLATEAPERVNLELMTFIHELNHGLIEKR
jgi:pimeloyl-ACP methyl ester carboxylesterase